MKNKNLLRILCATILIGQAVPLTAASLELRKTNQNAISYQEVGDLYLASFGIVESTAPQIDSTPNDKKKINLEIPELSDYQKRNKLFDILARAQSKETTASINNEALRVLLKELDVYFGSGHDSSKSLLNQINHTTTTLGDVTLAHLLSCPVKTDSLKKRQQFIQSLINDPELFNSIETILTKIKKAESGFLSYWASTDTFTEDFFKKLYWSYFPNTLNTSPVALETHVRMGNMGTVLQSSQMPISIGVAVGANCVGAYYEAKSLGYNDGFLSFTANRMKEMKAGVSAAYNAAKELYANEQTRKLVYILGGAAAAYTTFLVGYQAYLAKVALGQAKETRDAINHLQTRLIDVATVVEGSRHLRNILRQDPVLKNGLVTNGIDSLFSLNNSNESFNQLLELLQTKTFKDNASFFSLSGRVLTANKLMVENKDNFSSMLAAIGEVDACLSMAKLYKKMQTERVKYSFVNFVETATPYISLQEFWNPFVDQHTVVTNSLELGHGTNASKIILTGSNTGGKSTILKAIMTSLLMGHTFGIAPATSMSVSPFAFLGSYLRVNDDTAFGESKFKAEVMRAKMLCDTLSSLENNQFGFAVIDELFTGTGSEKAAIAASKVAEKLGSLDNNLFILATHFPTLTELAQAHPHIFKNCKVDVYKDEAGNLVRPFKLENGISDSNVANEILQEQMTDIDFEI